MSILKNSERGDSVRKLLLGVLIAIFLVTSAFAIHDAGYGGYGGMTSRERRLYDPYSRQQYFGEFYYRPFANFGSKGPTHRITNTGAKSAYSGVFNLDTNSVVNQGRNPGKISNWDPGMKGQSRLDVPVTLLPYSSVDLAEAGKALYSKGTARILSQGQAYGIGQNHAQPFTQIQVQTRDLPPLDSHQIYEVWLLDEDTGFSQNLGILKVGLEGTGQLLFTMSRMVDLFDYVMITMEDFPDQDPSPSGNIVVFGEIPQTRVSTRPWGSDFSLRYR